MNKANAPERNAAIWYADDGYDPAKGMNGRRVAGKSFIEGFFRHASVDQFLGVVPSVRSGRGFRALAAPYANGRPVRIQPLSNVNGSADFGTVFYPAPLLQLEAQRRFFAGQAAFSLCGITHTTSTTAVMQGIFDMRMAPVEPWDAVICTSNAVQTSIRWQMDQVDAYIERRFGYAPPPRPMTPVIPLGVNKDEFRIKAAIGNALRKKLGIPKSTRVAMIMSRLTVEEKFDPLPAYRALQLAQRQFKGKLALILCGYFGGPFDKHLFESGAKMLMPDVELHIVDGKDPDQKAAAFSASDFFLFPIDNLQETFGIAPLEAMAAGLPVIASDWDGMRDTISPDVGFRIPTCMARDTGHYGRESLRYLTTEDAYHTYLTKIAGMTQIDVPSMADKILLLARDTDLTKKMGAAARRRVAQMYDWSVIIPRYQDLWAEQTQMRLGATEEERNRYKGLGSPVVPHATDLFRSYPTETGLEPATRFVANTDDDAGAEKAIKALAALRRTRYSERSINVIVQLHQAFAADPAGTTLQDAINTLGVRPAAAERFTVWLLKYDFIRVAE